MYQAEQTRVLNDRGVGGDAVAGDHVYSAALAPAGLAAGQMLRWRYEATDNQAHTTRLPRFDDPLDSPQYFGTVAVDASIVSKLPVVHWFIENPAAADAAIGGVCAIWYLDRFYDNVWVNLHGNSSQSWVKKSYNFDFTGEQRFTYREGERKVKDIDILSNWADKSKCRNTAAYAFYGYGGGLANFAFPVRVQQNGAFYSVADMVEDTDNRYLERIGLDGDGALYKMANSLTSSTNAVEKKTRREENNDDLQALIDGLGPSGSTAYLYDHFDIPSLVNYLARHAIIENTDHGHKNYCLYRDTDDSGDWLLLPWDLDLSFGHSWSALQSFDDTINTVGAIVPWSNNRLYLALLNSPPTRSMFMRRIRSLMDEPLMPAGTPFKERYFEPMISNLVENIDPEPGISDADLDYAKWGSWGNLDDMRAGAGRITNEYLVGRRTYLYQTASVDNGGEIPHAQPAQPRVTLGRIECFPAAGLADEDFVELVNTNNYAVDISQWQLKDAVTFTFAAGTVIPAGGNLYVSSSVYAFRRRSVSPKEGESCFVVGNYSGRLSETGETVELRDKAGRLVDSVTYEDHTTSYLGGLRVTEVMYHSPYWETDFIELCNTGLQPISLDEMRFTEGITFNFAAGAVTTLQPGQHVVVVDNVSAFTNHYAGGAAILIAGEYGGDLSDAGEDVTLVNIADRSLVFAARFGDGWGWPLAADGAGHSLVPLVPDGQANGILNYGGNWRASAYIGGSPGAVDAEPPADVCLNEVQAHTDYSNPARPEYDSNDAIELYNRSANAVALDDWYLSDDVALLKKWAVPAGRFIGGNGFKRFTEVDDFRNPITSGFGLDKTGERLFLSYLPGTSADRVADAVRFKGQENGRSLGRCPDGGPWWQDEAVTTNAPNASPESHVVISELMYHPAPTAAHPEDNDNDEFVELFNPTAVTVGLWNTVGPWRLDGAIAYAFPSNSTLAPGAYVVVVGFDPSTDVAARADFLQAYGLTNGQVRLMGPWDGRLSNMDERLAIEEPQAADPPETDISWVVIDEVIYGDNEPWPTGADGSGGSLARRQGTGSGNEPGLWQLDVAGTPGTSMPTIGIGTPPDHSELAIPFSIAVQAVVDSRQFAGHVHRVEFWLNDVTKLGEASGEPYEAILDYRHIATAGTNTLKAVLVDDNGATVSPAVTVVCKPSVRVALSAPGHGALYASPHGGFAQADIDPRHTFAPIAVEFFANGSISLGVDTTAPYAASLAPLSGSGSYDLTAVITDDYGASTSAVRRITVYTNQPALEPGGTYNQIIFIDKAAILNEAISFNGLPQSLCTYAWSMLSGPGTVTFSDPHAPYGAATFLTAGVYVFQFVLTYGANSQTNTATVTVEDSNRPNAIRYEESFEAYGSGTDVLGMRGWYGEAGSAEATVVTNDYAALYGHGYPLSLVDHDLSLRLSGTVTNRFAGAESQTNLWFDMVLEAAYWLGTPSELDAVARDKQFAVAFDESGRLLVRHCPDPTNAPASNAWAVVEGHGFDQHEYIRLTIQADYQRDAQGFFRFRLFANEEPITEPKTWFACANTNQSFLSAAVLTGDVYLDDLVVDAHSPLGTRLVRATASSGGTVTPEGDIYIALNDGVTFTMTPHPYFHVERVTVDGTNMGAIASYAFADVTAEHAIDVAFGEDLAAGQTPHWWLAAMNPDFTNDFDAAELNDFDLDGLFTWEEYIAGTHAANPWSVFEIRTLRALPGGGQELQWRNAANRFYSVMRMESPLAEGQKAIMASNLPADPSGTNVWVDTNTVHSGFYRLGVRK